MAGTFASELDDILAKIGLDRADAVGFEGVVKIDLLGHHRLRLGDPRRRAARGRTPPHRVADEVQHEPHRLGAVLCAMHDDAVGGRLGGELREIFVKPRHDVGFDRVRARSPRGVVGHLGEGGNPAGLAPERVVVERRLQVGVANRCPDALAKWIHVLRSRAGG